LGFGLSVCFVLVLCFFWLWVVAVVLFLLLAGCVGVNSVDLISLFFIYLGFVWFCFVLFGECCFVLV